MSVASTQWYKNTEQHNHHYLASANSHKPATETCHNRHYEHSSSKHHEQYFQHSHQTQSAHHTHNGLNTQHKQTTPHGHHKEHGAVEFLSHEAHAHHTKLSAINSSGVAHGAIHEMKKESHGNKCMTKKDEYKDKEKCGKKKKTKEGRCSDDSSSGIDSD